MTGMTGKSTVVPMRTDGKQIVQKEQHVRDLKEREICGDMKCGMMANV